MNATKVTSIVFLPHGSAVLGFVCGLIIAIFGTIANSLVIVTLLKYVPKIKNEASTKFVLNLAVSDVVFCSITLPFSWIRYLFRDHPSLGDALCKIHLVTFYWTFELSLLSITFVTINRLILIAYNTYYDRIYTKRNVWFMIAFCWSFTLFLTSFPLFRIWGEFSLDTHKFSCSLRELNGSSPTQFFFALGFTIPFLTIIFTYAIIWHKIRRHNENFKRNKNSKRNYKFFIFIILIFGGLLVCYLPYMINKAVPSLKQYFSKDGYRYMAYVAIILVWLNSCLNPIIYFGFNDKYRQGLRRILTQISTRLGRKSITTLSISNKTDTHM